jgi:hypothetical protein
MGGIPSGVDAKDDLKDFKHALTVQATSQQVAEFHALRETTEAASKTLQAFRQEVEKEENATELSTPLTALERDLEASRSKSNKFVEGFSEAQQSGLKDIAKKLAKADSELAEEAQRLTLVTSDAKILNKRLAHDGETLDRALTNFSNLQLSLGREMSIDLVPGNQALSLNIPPAKTVVNLANQPITITDRGVISEAPPESGQSIFKLKMYGDLSSLQQSVTEVLHSELDRSDRCGERIAVLDAALTPAAPASLVVLDLHYERWTCANFLGGGGPNELFESNGTFEVKLTPTVGRDGDIQLVTEAGRIDAAGLFGESLRSGFLGSALQRKITQALLPAIQTGADLKLTLPQAAQGHATIQQVSFQGSGAGDLEIVLDGQVRLSDEQAKVLVNQLGERLSSATTGSQ